MRGCKKVNFLEINERGDPNKVREVGKNRKIDKRGDVYLAPESTNYVALVYKL